MADGTSIRDGLKAAMDAAGGMDVASGGAAEAVEALAPVVDAPVTPAPDPAPATPAEPAPAADGSTARDAQGRFAPKAGQEGAQAAAPAQPKPNTETAAPAGEGPQTEATRIPPSLPAAVKAQWGDLKPEVQQAFHKLEETVQTAKAEWGRKGERLNRYDEIFGPRLDRWRVAGLDEFSGIQTLLAAQDLLDRDLVGGIAEIARSYGVSRPQLAQALGLQQTSAPQSGAEGQPAPTAQPDFSAALQPVLQRLQTFEQQFAQQSQASEAAKMAEAQAEVEAFRADPKNTYFDNVREDVVERLSSGRAKTLADAYDQAIWASPDVRPHLLAEQAKSAQAAATARAAEEAQRTRAVRAAQASGSVTGSPTPGAQALTSGPALPLRDELKANLAAARAQV